MQRYTVDADSLEAAESVLDDCISAALAAECPEVRTLSILIGVIVAAYVSGELYELNRFMGVWSRSHVADALGIEFEPEVQH